MQKTYAQAIARQLQAGADEATLVSGLVAHLTKEGKQKLLPGILTELKRIAHADAKLAPRVEVARAGDAESALAAAQKAGIAATEVVVNPDLIRGWRARSGSTLVDRSAKQALVDLYQRITN